MRWTSWLRWTQGRHTRRAAKALAAAEAAQEAERLAARQRLLDIARRNAGPGWQHESTVPLPVLNRPLMTPGQAWRGNRGRR
jgi:type II secretory pathway pseudopilin PulG